jgi:hypothetical protein
MDHGEFTKNIICFWQFVFCMLLVVGYVMILPCFVIVALDSSSTIGQVFALPAWAKGCIAFVFFTVWISSMAGIALSEEGPYMG